MTESERSKRNGRLTFRVVAPQPQWMPKWASNPQPPLIWSDSLFALELERRGIAVQGLLTVADRMMGREFSTADAPLAALEELGRAAKTLRAVCMLCSFGYGQQAQMLARVLFESAMCVRWCFLHKDIADDYLQAHIDLALEVTTQAKKKSKLFRNLPKAEMTEERRIKAQNLFGKRATKLWTGHDNLKDLVSEVVASMDPDEARIVSLTFEIPVDWSNRTSHSTGISNRSHRYIDPSGVVMGHTGASRHDLFDALLLAGSSFTLMMDSVTAAIAPDLVGDLEAASARMWRAWKPIQKLTSLTATSKCICDFSSAPWSECHGVTDKFADREIEARVLRAYSR